jgi:fatty aldehyde-generating acyl-ACP reductase
MSPTGTFAFLVQSRMRVSEPPTSLGRLSQRVLDATARRLPIASVRSASVTVGGVRLGHLLLVPSSFGAGAATSVDLRRRVDRAVDHAVRVGSSVVGLGAQAASFTAGGVWLRGRTDVALTNGNALTAAVVHDQLRAVLKGAPDGRVAIVGATGSVGATVAKLLVRGREAAELVLVGKDERRLQSLACNLSGRGIAIRFSSLLDSIRNCDVVVLAAGSDSLLQPRHLRACAVVLDATEPRLLSADIVRCRPDVLVLDGGLVTVPSVRFSRGGLGLPDGSVPAALAETALLALSGQSEHFCVGMPDLSHVDRIRALAHSYASLGFRAAAQTSFGMPVGAGSVSEPSLVAA